MNPTTLLLTRPRLSAQAFTSNLDASALDMVDVIVAPLMRIEGTGAVPDLKEVAAVIFTSSNGVMHAPEGEGHVAFCVGARTTQAANARGWRAEMAGETAQELIDALKLTRPKGPLLHLGGAYTRGNISQNLSQMGMQAGHIALYTQTLLPLEKVAAEALHKRCIVPLFSPRSAHQLVQEAHGKLQNAQIVALSEAVAAPFKGEKTAQMYILPAPKAEYMRKAVENLCLNRTLP